MKLPKPEITITISIDTLEAIEAGINSAIREIQTGGSRQQDQLPLLWDCRSQIDAALAAKLKKFKLCAQEAEKRSERGTK